MKRVVMIKTINLETLQQRVQEDARVFRKARPFPHIMFDDLLVEGLKEQILSVFPQDSWNSWYRFQDQCQFRKLACDQIDRIPEPLDRLILELNSGPVLRWISTLTGIAQLLPDPWLQGGGLHSSGPGGFLLPHTDFHLGRLSHYYRRVNLLLYVNESWSEANGGALELWDKERDCVAKEVWPKYGRCVIFQTDARSVHGFSKPIVERDRNSIALYYYTMTAPENFSGDGSTHWRASSMKRKGAVKDIQRIAYRICMATSSRFSKLGWYFRPD
jgi:hypothetical protein